MPITLMMMSPSPLSPFVAAAAGPFLVHHAAWWAVALAGLGCALGAGFHFGRARAQALTWAGEHPGAILSTIVCFFLILPFFLPERASRGDNYFTAWVITFGYFIAAGLTFWAATKEKGEAIGRMRRGVAPAFWFTLGGLLICLGFNKQFDLQTDFTIAGRKLAQAEGWYGSRRAVQAVFVMLFGLGAVAAVFGAAWYLRDLFKRYRLAFIGIIYICAFVIIRAASFHHIDQILYYLPGVGFLMNTVLELGGIAMIGYAAWRAATAKGPQQNYKSFQRKVSIK